MIEIPTDHLGPEDMTGANLTRKNGAETGRLMVVLMIGLMAPLSLVAGPVVLLVGPPAAVLTTVLFSFSLRKGALNHPILLSCCSVLQILNLVVGYWVWGVLRD